MGAKRREKVTFSRSTRQSYPVKDTGHTNRKTRKTKHSHVVAVEDRGELGLAPQQGQGFLEGLFAGVMAERVVVDGGPADVVEVVVALRGRKGAEHEREPPENDEALLLLDGSDQIKRGRNSRGS